MTFPAKRQTTWALEKLDSVILKGRKILPSSVKKKDILLRKSKGGRWPRCWWLAITASCDYLRSFPMKIS